MSDTLLMLAARLHVDAEEAQHHADHLAKEAAAVKDALLSDRTPHDEAHLREELRRFIDRQRLRTVR